MKRLVLIAVEIDPTQFMDNENGGVLLDTDAAAMEVVKECVSGITELGTMAVAVVTDVESLDWGAHSADEIGVLELGRDGANPIQDWLYSVAQSHDLV